MKCEDVPLSLCTGCGLCKNICPKNAALMEEGEDGFMYPHINLNSCVDCGLCYSACPVILAEQTDRQASSPVSCYYGHNRDKTIQKSSSSGGVFAALAQNVINDNGVVFGATFDYTSIQLFHTSTDKTDIKTLQGSKYVQSDIGLSYQEVKQALKKGRKVLFVGTPCQCAGLNAYLKNSDVTNLLVCDFICHGVPSSSLLKQHLQYLGIKSEVDDIKFRPKETGWIDYLKISRKGKVIYKNKWEYDPYFYLFEHAVTLRQSCYKCFYSGGYRKADITIADFWGYHRLNKDIYNKDGLSMIITYDQKGDNAIKELINEGHIVTQMDSSLCKYAFKDANKSIEKRNLFFDDLKQHGYKKAIKRYGFNRFKSSVLFYVCSIKQYLRNIIK